MPFNEATEGVGINGMVGGGSMKVAA